MLVDPRHAESPAYSQSLGQWNKLSPIASHIRPDSPEPYGSPADGLRDKTSIFSHPVYLFLREFSLRNFRGGSDLTCIILLYINNLLLLLLHAVIVVFIGHSLFFIKCI